MKNLITIGLLAIVSFVAIGCEGSPTSPLVPTEPTAPTPTPPPEPFYGEVKLMGKVSLQTVFPNAIPSNFEGFRYYKFRALDSLYQPIVGKTLTVTSGRYPKGTCGWNGVATLVVRGSDWNQTDERGEAFQAIGPKGCYTSYPWGDVWPTKIRVCVEETRNDEHPICSLVRV